MVLYIQENKAILNSSRGRSNFCLLATTIKCSVMFVTVDNVMFVAVSFLLCCSVTHGCIIATVKLYLNEVEVPGHEPPVQQVLHIVQVYS